MSGRNPFLVERLQGLGTTIFAEMSALAARTGAINLGQGFPDTDGPIEVAEAAVAAIREGHNQYPPGIGIAPLREAIAAHQQRFWGLTFDPDTEVLVTAGATEALAAAIIALCEPGEEILTFEPTYDSYRAVAAMAGATVRAIRLEAPDHRFDLAALDAAVSDRTKLVLLNSPHNPTGKVFDETELDAVARLCVERDLVAVTDEVYEHMVFDGAHVPLASRPGMAERTVTISSAGKTFSFTGWKIGWACGPEDLVAAVRTAKQFLTFVNGAPFQPAVAVGLGLDDGYFVDLCDGLRQRRDLLCDGLADVGFTVHRPAGTYFATADIRPLTDEDGATFCRALPERCGVVAVPMSAFYEDPGAADHLIRFSFCKRPEVLEAAVRQLAQLRAD
jgi:N-succinyldiaminopimelate aminotransferase